MEKAGVYKVDKQSIALYIISILPNNKAVSKATLLLKTRRYINTIKNYTHLYISKQSIV